MKRILVQLDEETARTLRERAFRQNRSIASLVREFVATGLGAGGGGRQRRRPFLSVAVGRSTRSRTSVVSEKHDAALSAAFKK
jgi:hypothetical protein